MEIYRQIVLTPEVIIESSNNRQCVVDGGIGPSLNDWLSWKHIEGVIGILEPEHKAPQVIEGDLLVVEVLLHEILEKELEAVSIRAQGISSAPNAVEVFEIPHHWEHGIPCLINHKVAFPLVTDKNFLNAHDFPFHGFVIEGGLFSSSMRTLKTILNSYGYLVKNVLKQRTFVSWRTLKTFLLPTLDKNSRHQANAQQMRQAKNDGILRLGIACDFHWLDVRVIL